MTGGGTVRIGINGFGRIGRTLCRALWTRQTDVEVVAVNDVVAGEQLRYLFETDSVGGRWPEPVEVDGDELRAGDRVVTLLHAAVPEELPWGDLGVEVVVESSRRFAAAAEARRHLDSGAAAVVVSAPSEGADATFVVGVNDHEFDPSHHRVVSNASCTTNCVAPMAKVLDDAFGIEDGLMTTVHAYTSEQALVDGAGGSSPRMSRAAAMNVVPTSTGAARAIRHVLPALDGRLDGSSLRVPVPDGSIADLTVALERRADVDEVNDAFRRAAGECGPLARVVEYSDKAVVSSDIVGNPASCVFDAPLTMARGRLVKVFGWYDNEWGYSNRLADLVEIIGAGLQEAC